ncbi:Non-specific serine/threonine protein kinase [Altererythrobacter insulae]|nr:Non-specific serine/threonine protein kinase [Altererythrobacter insulae]
MADVFLSYARADQAQIERLGAALEADGKSLWWDRKIEGGRHFAKDIEQQLRLAGAVVVAWSKTSVESHWVLDEAGFARDEDKLIPITLDGTLPPFGFRQIQSIDFSNWPQDEGALVALQRAIAHCLENGATAASLDGSEQDLSMTPKAFANTGVRAPATANFSNVSRRNLIIGGVALTGGASLLAGWQMGWLGPGGPSSMSMAVLPFANLTGSDGQAWFSNGFSNELRQALSRNPLLKVSAPTSSNAGNGEDDFAIARALGAASILRGSVQLVDQTVRIFAELLQVDDGVVLWSESYDREFKDVLAVQSEIAGTVALSLVERVASEDTARESLEDQKDVGGTDNPQAYEAYLRGQAFYELGSGLDSKRSALGQFDLAIELDPNYASAHARRANSLASIANAANDAGEVGRLFAESVAAAELAIEIAPDLAQGHMALAYVRYYGQIDRTGAYPHYKRAEELAPGDADALRSIATFYSFGDQTKLAMEIMDRVIELDPLNALAFRSAGFVALFARSYETAIVRMERALELNPSLANANYAIGVAQIALSKPDLALKAFEAETVALFGLTGLAIAQRKLNQFDAAKTSYDRLVAEYGDSGLYQQAQVLAQWGEADQALRVLERAFDAGDPGVVLTTNDPLIDPLRGSAQLNGLLLKLA